MTCKPVLVLRTLYCGVAEQRCVFLYVNDEDLRAGGARSWSALRGAALHGRRGPAQRARRTLCARQ